MTGRTGIVYEGSHFSGIPWRGGARVRDAPAQVMSQEADPCILQGLPLKYVHLRKLKRLKVISSMK